jgi:hypothetical protein
MEIDKKKLLIGAGVLVIGYLAYKSMKNKSTISKTVVAPTVDTIVKPTVRTAVALTPEQEKIQLFERGVLSYEGGVAPNKMVLDNIAKTRNDALAKIKNLMLDAEFATWKSKRTIDKKAPPRQ